MQEKVIFDANIYIGIFNRGLYQDEINAFNKIMYLVHPVLHELWMGAKGVREIKHMMRFSKAFIRLGRLVKPEPATQMLIGRVCQRLRATGKLDPKNPRNYKDICIALLARQIGATVVTDNIDDFRSIKEVIAFRFRGVS